MNRTIKFDSRLFFAAVKICNKVIEPDQVSLIKDWVLTKELSNLTTFFPSTLPTGAFPNQSGWLSGSVHVLYFFKIKFLKIFHFNEINVNI